MAGVPSLRSTPFVYLLEDIMPNKTIESIRNTARSIYDACDDDFLIPTDKLEAILRERLAGLSLTGIPLRTRSKVVKSAICQALGYPVPKSFKKTHPRFPAQNFDTYTQKSDNVQIWNEDITPERRYVFLRANEHDIITAVRIITGDQLAKLDRTGTLTQKYQASMRHFGNNSLFSTTDTPTVARWCSVSAPDLSAALPTDLPTFGNLLPVSEIYKRLLPLVGTTIRYLDALQDRNRGSELHAAICQKLGYSQYADNGSYPDIVHQLIEVKLQTSPTIDLGLHSPEDGRIVIRASGQSFKSDDIRYVVFDASVENKEIRLNNLYIINGRDFTGKFPLFRGKVQNRKRQIPLPKGFFD